MSKAELAARETRIVQMRRARANWAEIGAAEGISPQRAHSIYQKALTDNPLSAIQVDEHRMEELELIDLATRRLLALALDTTAANGRPTVSARTKVEAWSGIRAWAERKAKLLGLDAPTQLQVTTIDELDQQIAALRAELEAMPEPDLDAVPLDAA